MASHWRPPDLLARSRRTLCLKSRCTILLSRRRWMLCLRRGCTMSLLRKSRVERRRVCHAAVRQA